MLRAIGGKHVEEGRRVERVRNGRGCNFMYIEPRRPKDMVVIWVDSSVSQTDIYGQHGETFGTEGTSCGQALWQKGPSMALAWKEGQHGFNEVSEIGSQKLK